MDALLRFFNRPITIKRAHPSRRVRVAFWCLLALWLMASVADLVTTAALLAAHSTHPTYHEGSPVVAWALAHGGRRAALARQVLPAAASDEYVQDAVDGAAVGRPRSPGAGRGRQQRSDEGSLHVSELNPVHAIRLSHSASVSEPPLALRNGEMWD